METFESTNLCKSKGLLLLYLKFKGNEIDTEKEQLQHNLHIKNL